MQKRPSPNTFIEHPYLKPEMIEQREYQISTVKQIMGKNSLVVLPTALGKTIIALYASVLNLEKSEKSRVLLVAPTRALVMQHHESFQKFLQENIKVGQFSSGMNPIMRSRMLNESHIIVSTPQIIQNDLRAGYYDLSGFSLLIFDEAHKARKNYSYTEIAKFYHMACPNMQILGLTASPGKNLEYINELCKVLFIENIVFKSSQDADVEPYIFPIDTYLHYMDLDDPVSNAQQVLEKWLQNLNDFFISKGVFPKKDYVSKMDFLRLMRDLKYIDQFGTTGSSSKGRRGKIDLPQEYVNELSNPYLIQSLNYSDMNISNLFPNCVRGIYLSHMIELLTSQDPRLFKRYIKQLWDKAKEGNKTALKLLTREEMKTVLSFLKEKITYPKIEMLKDIIFETLENPESKIIIFTQFREMASIIVHELNRINEQSQSQSNSKRAKLVPKLLPTRFVGQASRIGDRGLNQKEQKQTIDAFRANEFNILVATSVAEEGLDIPNVDCVIFYEPVPSEIRTIQRRGRTGRFSIGYCHVLIAKNTVDEVYFRVSQRKEEEMQKLLSEESDGIIFHEVDRDQEVLEFKTLDVESIIEQYTQTRAEKRLQKEKDTIMEVQILQLDDDVIVKDVVNEFLGVQDVTRELLAISESKNVNQEMVQKQKEVFKALKKRHSASVLSQIVEIFIDNGSSISDERRKTIEPVQNRKFEETNRSLLGEDKDLQWIALDFELKKDELFKLAENEGIQKTKVSKELYTAKKTFAIIENNGYLYLNGFFV